MNTQWLTTHRFEPRQGEPSPAKLARAVAQRGVARLSGFPSDATTLIRFLAQIGQPIEYYGGSVGSHPEQAALWRVRYEVEAAERQETHALDGPLSVHSSQSLLDPRPRYFGMLMVDPGWQGDPVGFNGESLLVPWSAAFRHLEAQSPADFAWVLDALEGPVSFPDGISRPVVYSLQDQRGPHDFGVRLKSDLLTHLTRESPTSQQTQAVERLSRAGDSAALRTQLSAHDLVLVDNDRWGHGRESVTGARRDQRGNLRVNPRELWSLTLR